MFYIYIYIYNEIYFKELVLHNRGGWQVQNLLSRLETLQEKLKLKSTG